MSKIIRTPAEGGLLAAAGFSLALAGSLTAAAAGFAGGCADTGSLLGTIMYLGATLGAVGVLGFALGILAGTSMLVAGIIRKPTESRDG